MQVGTEMLIRGECLVRPETHRERNGGGYFLGTSDNSIGQYHPFCAFEGTRSRNAFVVIMGSGLSFNASSSEAL